MEALKLIETLDAEAYLCLEEASDVRHEFVCGQMYAMAGESRRHNEIALNTAIHLRQTFAQGPCRVYFESIKLQVSFASDRHFYYPDILVTCEPEDNDPYCVRQPRLIVEVSSPSTRNRDSREKLLAYMRIPSLQSYWIVNQELPEVLLYTRGPEDWSRGVMTEGTIRQPQLGIALPLAAIYA